VQNLDDGGQVMPHSPEHWQWPQRRQSQGQRRHASLVLGWWVVVVESWGVGKRATERSREESCVRGKALPSDGNKVPTK